MPRLIILFALIAILTAHFVFSSSLLMFSALILAFSLTNFIRQTYTEGDTISNWVNPRVEKALWWAVFAVLAYRLLVLISEYFYGAPLA